MKNLTDLFEECKERYKLHLFAGRDGLSKEVKRAYQAEDHKLFSFLRGGELVITTGMTYDGTKEWFLELLQGLVENNASGLIINTGLYIRPGDITPEIRRLFDEAFMPLFLMPWEIHIGDLIQEVTNHIFRQDQEQSIIDNLFADMLLDSPIRTEQALKLEAYGFRGDANYNVLCISDINSITGLKSILEKNGLMFHILRSYDKTIAIFESPGEKAALSISDDILHNAGMKRGDKAVPGKPVIGMGEEEYALSRIRFVYRDAANALKIAQKSGVNFVRFGELGPRQLLLSIENTDMLIRIRQKYLGPLEDYDHRNGSCLKETLRLYLYTGGSPASVAEKMFTHRNTINSRMRKIRELLPFDLEDPDHLFIMKMAYYIHDDL